MEQHPILTGERVWFIVEQIDTDGDAIKSAQCLDYGGALILGRQWCDERDGVALCNVYSADGQLLNTIGGDA